MGLISGVSRRVKRGGFTGSVKLQIYASGISNISEVIKTSLSWFHRVGGYNEPFINPMLTVCKDSRGNICSKGSI